MIITSSLLMTIYGNIFVGLPQKGNLTLSLLPYCCLAPAAMRAIITINPHSLYLQSYQHISEGKLQIWKILSIYLSRHLWDGRNANMEIPIPNTVEKSQNTCDQCIWRNTVEKCKYGNSNSKHSGGKFETHVISVNMPPGAEKPKCVCLAETISQVEF